MPLSFGLLYFLFISLCITRYELDFFELDKFAEHFHASLDVVVSEKDRPSQKPPPWTTFETKRLTPKYCFSGQEEWDSVTAQFGKTPPSQDSIQKYFTLFSTWVNYLAKFSIRLTLLVKYFNLSLRQLPTRLKPFWRHSYTVITILVMSYWCIMSGMVVLRTTRSVLSWVFHMSQYQMFYAF